MIGRTCCSNRGLFGADRDSLAGQTACVNSLKLLVRQTATTSLVNGQVNVYDQITVIRTTGTPSRWARRAPEPLTTVAELKMRRPMPEELPDPVNLYTRVRQRRPLPGLPS
jgi:hypothetical protein